MFIRTLIIFLFISGVAWGQNLTPSTHALNPADFTGKYIYSDGTSFIPVSKSEVRGYKCYVALLTQTDTNPPVATELENDLGEIVWTRVNVGTYRASIEGHLFDGSKTIVVPNQYAIYASNGAGIYLQYNVSGGDIEFSVNYNEEPVDGYLTNTFVEIREYIQ